VVERACRVSGFAGGLGTGFAVAEKRVTRKRSLL
jgi:hypothetical protein